MCTLLSIMLLAQFTADFQQGLAWPDGPAVNSISHLGVILQAMAFVKHLMENLTLSSMDMCALFPTLCMNACMSLYTLSPPHLLVLCFDALGSTRPKLVEV